MTAFAQFCTQPLVHALGWTLLHFCWQGAVIALLLECVLGVLPTRTAQTRYATACAAMAAMVVLPLVTFAVLAADAHTVSSPYGLASGVASYSPAVHGIGQLHEPWTMRCKQALDQSLSAVIGLWLAGVMLLMFRLNLGFVAARKMKSQGIEPVAAEMLNAMQILQVTLGIDRTVRLLHSARVQAPVVIGWLRPVILFPVGCMTGLSAAQIEAILAHELAHIRRCDYLVNLMQSVVESVLFYHPAVWWVSSRIRREREHCCDDIAVTFSGDRLAYAKALSCMEEMRAPATAGAVAATGGALKTRVARLLGLNREPVFPRPAAAILLVLVTTSAGLVVLRAVHAAPAAPQQSTSTTTGNFGDALTQWLNQDVRWIITPEERQAFLRLTTNQQRVEFIRQFWERRNPNPGSSDNEFKKEHYRRLAYASAHFGWKQQSGWQTSRGHVYIVFGPPDSIDSHPRGGMGSAKPNETWHYRSIRLVAPPTPNPNGSGYTAQTVIRNNVDFRFVDDCGCGQYDLESPWPSATTAVIGAPRDSGNARARFVSLVPAGQNNRANSAPQVTSAEQPGNMPVRIGTLAIISDDLTEAARHDIAIIYEGETYPLQELVERIRQNLRDRGYAKAKVELLQPLYMPPVPPVHPVDVLVRISAGDQYRITGIEIEGGRSIPGREILAQFPIRPGELFNATAIGKGLDAVKKLFVAKGYTKVGLIPRLQTNDVLHTVTLIVQINGDTPEGPVSSFGSISVTFLSDTQGVDFGPYIAAWQKITQATWEKLIPQYAKPPILRRGVVTIRFKILPNGQIMDGSMILEGHSGSAGLDRAAWGALTGSEFPPLPSGFQGPYLALRTEFLYNQRPQP